MIPMAKWIFEKIALSRGYRLIPEGLAPRGFTNLLTLAKSKGLAPKTIFDIGVGYGTPWLYDAFPTAKLVLVEPLPIFADALDDLVRKYGASSHHVALGKSNKSATLRIPHHAATGASIWSKSTLLDQSERERGLDLTEDRIDVPVVTLDEINCYPGPYVLKIDVEGSELEVLLGARETLSNCHLIILEISVFPRFAGAPKIAELIHFMDGAGFELFDLPELHNLRAHECLAYVDAVFHPRAKSLW